MRRKNFPFFNKKKAVVTGRGRAGAFGYVTPKPRSSDIVALQSRGGTRVTQSRGLLIRTDRSKWGRRFTKAQRSKQFTVGAKGGKRVVLQRFKRQPNKVVAVLSPSAKIGRNFQWEKAGVDPALVRSLQFYANIYFRKEFKGWEERVNAAKPVFR